MDQTIKPKNLKLQRTSSFEPFYNDNKCTWKARMFPRARQCHVYILFCSGVVFCSCLPTFLFTYVTMVPWGNEMLRCMPYFLHPCECLLHFEAAAVFTAGAFILPGRYVISAGDVSWDSLGWITHVCQSVGTQGRSQSVIGRSVSFPQGTMLHT